MIFGLGMWTSGDIVLWMPVVEGATVNDLDGDRPQPLNTNAAGWITNRPIKYVQIVHCLNRLLTDWTTF